MSSSDHLSFGFLERSCETFPSRCTVMSRVSCRKFSVRHVTPVLAELLTIVKCGQRTAFHTMQAGTAFAQSYRRFQAGPRAGCVSNGELALRILPGPCRVEFASCHAGTHSPISAAGLTWLQSLTSKAPCALCIVLFVRFAKAIKV